MIHIVNGNLLESDCTIVAHQANCYKTMGTGIALQIRKKYPEAYQADINFPLSSEERFGRCSRTYSKDRTKVIVNLYGQYRYGRDKRYTDYDKVRSALEEMMRGMEILEQSGFKVKIGVPHFMGCKNAGGDWAIVEGILRDVSEKYRRDIYVYQLEEKK